MDIKEFPYHQKYEEGKEYIVSTNLETLVIALSDVWKDQRILVENKEMQYTTKVKRIDTDYDNIKLNIEDSIFSPLLAFDIMEKGSYKTKLRCNYNIIFPNMSSEISDIEIVL